MFDNITFYHHFCVKNDDCKTYDFTKVIFRDIAGGGKMIRKVFPEMINMSIYQDFILIYLDRIKIKFG